MVALIRNTFYGIALLAILSCFGVSSCSQVQRPYIPPYIHVDAVPEYVEGFPRVWFYPQPEKYRTWWKEIAKCEGFADAGSKADSVRFFVVNAKWFTMDSVQYYVNAAAVLEANEVLISLPITGDESIVKHEMAHYHIYWAGDSTGGGSHPKTTFETCGLHVMNPRR